jgi:membrane-bound serine protease (ClpP class)
METQLDMGISLFISVYNQNEKIFWHPQPSAQSGAHTMIEILLDPNVAYLTLVLAFLMTIMAILTPGTAIFEVTALLLLVVAGWQVYNLPINWWALVLLTVGLILFFIAVYRSTKHIFLALSILAFIVGSLFLFQGDTWYDPAVNPILAIIVSVLMGGFLWIATIKVVEARNTPPTQDLGRLVGQIGEAKSYIHSEGSVQVAGELWTARSDTLIPPGSRVRVIERDGFFLIVESVEENNGES